MGADTFTLRPWSRDDLAAMAAVINARVAEEGGEDEQATEQRMAEVYDHLVGSDPATDIVVAADASDAVVGYARLRAADVAEGYRGYFFTFDGRAEFDGLLDQMLAWVIERAEQAAAEHYGLDRRLTAYTTDGSRRERALLGAGGFEPGWFPPSWCDHTSARSPASTCPRVSNTGRS